MPNSGNNNKSTVEVMERSKFWEFNIGHAATLLVFIFGLGFSWAKFEASVEKVAQSNQAHYDDLLSQINRNKSEQGITIDYLQRRVEKVEGSQVVIDDLRTTVNKLTYQVDTLTSAIKDLQSDLKTQKKQ